ncbi:cytochrome-c peroxidase [Adhaeribacter aerolatus]|uniref:Cytochrome-c peroxidase n=1 Tax=Adhaeribacter aerolatus TaxID=670289 RepID=A0A512AVH9_9BACT|nr:cytochrome c peroxidase [Adhaeribacter aerolatus]GEO03722.1 cytochrome-c peroxidase [Adhaeribacter aerolatus]
MSFTLAGSVSRPYNAAGVDGAVSHFRSASQEFAQSTAELQSAIKLINNQDQETIEKAKNALKNSRLHYKRIEAFLEYFFKHAAVAYNAPAKVEIEEPTLEINEAAGLQQIEALLFTDDVEAQKKALLQQAEFIYTSATDLNSLLHNFKADDKQLFESQQLELVRVMTLAITGFDAPFLKSGMAEAHEALAVMAHTLKPILNKQSKSAEKINFYLNGTLNYLKKNQDFDTFDRLAFLTDYALPLQVQLNKYLKEQGLELNTAPVLNYKAHHLFNPGALQISGFPNAERISAAAPVIKLGKTLFAENALSGDNSRSCVTCHNPNKYFTDGLPKSIGLNGHAFVPRNAPTLLYAGFQQTQFWDGRVTSLADQVKEVISSPIEMNGKPREIIKWLQQQEKYKKMFAEAFPNEPDSLVTMGKISKALASFIFTLQPYNSPFDKYMQGNKNALTADQVKGANLFMGKAQCGTCHFAPLFNGLLPPFYQISEVEVLGVTRTDNLEKPEVDQDKGRYGLYPIEFYEGSFKTPTVRNVAPTGPYMHNGAFDSLEKVMDFYNKGGGAGLGLNIENQTLGDQPLNLTETEIKNIISFLHALTDATAQEQASANAATNLKN